MKKQELIEIAHEAQAVAGSLAKFNELTTKYMHTEFTSKADPVAAFLGALKANHNDGSGDMERGFIYGLRDTRGGDIRNIWWVEFKVHTFVQYEEGK